MGLQPHEVILLLVVVVVAVLGVVLMALLGRRMLHRVGDAARRSAEDSAAADQHLSERIDELTQLVRKQTQLIESQAEELARGIERVGYDEHGRRRSDDSPVALVVNPIKLLNPTLFRRTVNRVCTELGYGLPMWLETTPDDPGFGQAKAAVLEGAETVIAAGGDGTVRAVAAALAGSEVTMGIVPMGTGNLLARNLDIPINTPEDALALALTGTDRRIDVGWLRYGESREEAERDTREIFLIIAGYGFDANIMTDTGDSLKRRLGWIAYVYSGAKHLLGRSAKAVVSVDGGEETVPMNVRTVLIGNVGKLPGGLDLMPDARIDNGHLEILALGWKGLYGFSTVAGAIMNPRVKVMKRLSTMERFEGEQLTVQSDQSLPVQLDGDAGGQATFLLAEVDHHALTVRVPNINALDED